MANEGYHENEEKLSDANRERIIEWRGKPDVIRCDNGPELISGELISWANKKPDNHALYPARQTNLKRLH